ncbi:MAG TPA: DUF4026 domain-containing protein [Phycisphaerae bacterium]|jgi:hypothetical protein|nr:DUF4026 domain-containing protein [Phycisphaerae bacterium]HOB73746.1 DUF4026 domain-containing protein [Phycisphaerae bacterium]HOJ53380.1 DUF4026 domain-containing protein [Phycisphaerae bacterium]HOL25496.1 DUF4026 domain-containing protein [Phycisphaerae bacterium]HPP19827.1 DUF4026 domain-containing protein [Phycisphaerae bacterium]
MLGWLKRKTQFCGSVHFRGTLPPRAEEFKYLEERGIQLAPCPPPEGMLWGLRMAHPDWGEATLLCPREPVTPPAEVVTRDYRLTQSEKEAARAARSSVLVHSTGPRSQVLRDRKLALRFLDAVMGADGLFACDHGAQRFWSPDALREELCHDADLDIDCLMSFHAVKEDDDSDKVGWLHSHGLAELGFFDFDILRPAEALLGAWGNDLLRAIAYAIVEEQASLSTPCFELARPGGMVRFVEVSQFTRLASPADVALRTPESDQWHHDRRAVLCDPVRRFLGRWFQKARPSRFLSSVLSDGLVISFSKGATELMAERARGTYRLFQELVAELAEFEFPALVKLGYPMDGGGGDGQEHLWFEVHECLAGHVDATLVNTPIAVAGLQEGRRALHPVEYLSDWVIMTPLGPINPRQTGVLRAIREKRDLLRARMVLAQHREDGEFDEES